MWLMYSPYLGGIYYKMTVSAPYHFLLFFFPKLELVKSSRYWLEIEKKCGWEKSLAVPNYRFWTVWWKKSKLCDLSHCLLGYLCYNDSVYILNNPLLMMPTGDLGALAKTGSGRKSKRTVSSQVWILTFLLIFVETLYFTCVSFLFSFKKKIK